MSGESASLKEPLSLKQTVAAIARGWQAFFHAPCDARIGAAVRITYSLIVLAHFAVLLPDLDRWFTEEGVLPLAASRELARAGAWSLLWWLPSTSDAVHTALWIAVAHTVLLLVGVLPRVNALCLFVWIVSFQNRNVVLLDGEDNVMRMIAFYLIWIPSGRAWSIESLVRRWWRSAVSETSRTEMPGWGIRLLQIQMTAILLSTGLAKLGGESWVNGTALYYVARLDDFFGRYPVPTWAFDTPWLVAFMTWAVLLAELGIPLLIWFRETRRFCLITLLLFHLSNEWTMHLFLFHWLMLCGWLAFVRPEDFAWIARRKNKEARA